MLRLFVSVFLLLVLGCFSLFFGACTLCFNDNSISNLGSDFTRPYEGMESVVYELSSSDTSGTQIDTVEFLIKERKLLFTDRDEFDDCTRYSETYYVHMESADRTYSAHQYLFAEDPGFASRQLGFSLMKNRQWKFVMRGADYPEDLMRRETLLADWDNASATYRADSGLLSGTYISSDTFTINRIK